MRTENLSGYSVESKVNHLGAVDLPCSWCGAAVHLFNGDYSGVCIDCGTVMFRKSIYHDYAGGPDVRRPGIIEKELPPPGTPIEAA